MDIVYTQCFIRTSAIQSLELVLGSYPHIETLRTAVPLAQDGVSSLVRLPSKGWHRIGSPRGMCVTTSSYLVGWEPSWQTIKEKCGIPVFYVSNKPLIQRGHLSK